MRSKGFTAVELIIACLIIGLVAAIAIPNYQASKDRAHEARVKANMHVFQLAAEDFHVRADSGYARDAADVAPFLATDFPNPFDRSHGENAAWEDRPTLSGNPSRRPGIVSYADTANGSDYAIKGYGRRRVLPIVLTGTLPDYGNYTPDDLDNRRRGESGDPAPAAEPSADPAAGPAAEPASDPD